MTHWRYLEKDKITQTFEYNRLGKSFIQKESIANCSICFTSESDLVGKSYSGGYSMICLKCLEKCNEIFDEFIKLRDKMDYPESNETKKEKN